MKRIEFGRAYNNYIENPSFEDGLTGWEMPIISGNLLTDGSFEEWDDEHNLTHWDESTSGSSTVNRESTDVVDGDYAVKLDVDADNSWCAVSQLVNITTGIYRFSFLGKITGGAYKLTLQDTTNNLYWDWENQTWMDTPKAKPFGNTDWEQHDTILVVMQSSSIDLKIEFARSTASNSQSIYIDNAKLEAIAGSVQQLTYAKDGNNVLALTYPIDGEARIQTNTITSLPAGTYEFSFWLYLPSNAGCEGIKMGYNTGGDDTIISNLAPKGNGWRLYTTYVTFATDQTNISFVIYISGKSGEVYYLDAVELVNTEDIYEIPINPISCIVPNIRGENIALMTTLDGSIVLQKYESGYDPRTYNLIWRGYLPLDRFESFYKYLKSLEYLTSGTVYIRDNDIGQIPMFMPINVLRVEAELREGGRPAYREIKMEFVRHEGS